MIIVPITETAIDPRQPRRLEKKANIVGGLSPLVGGAVVNGCAKSEIIGFNRANR
jgi:hypothetical protein